MNTNKSQNLAEKCLKEMLSDFKMPVVGYSDCFPPKPDPSGVKKLIDHFSCRPEETVYVGDGVTDALTAYNAKLRFIYCAWGQGAKEDVLNLFPFAEVANDVQDLARRLEVLCYDK